jgi:tetratricopeptide (TPR) repeat protein
VPDLPAYEHRLYVPALGLAIGLAWWLGERTARPEVRVLAVLAVVLAACGWSVRAYLPVFQNPMSYWGAAAAGTPFAPRALVNLGLLYERQGDIARAEASYRRALDLDPVALKANNNLGTILARRQDYVGARRAFEREFAAHPDNADAAYNLGVLDKIEGHSDRAVPWWERTIALDSHYASAYEQLAQYFEARGDAERAAGYRERLRDVRGPR